LAREAAEEMMPRVDSLDFRPGLFRDRVEAGEAAVILVASHDVATIDRLSDELAPEELMRAGRFRFSEDRNAYVAGHAAIICLTRLLLGAPACWRIVAGTNGKPEVRTQGLAPLHISLSHTRGLIAAAFGRVAPLGVDVEAGRALSDGAALMQHVLSQAERAALERSNSPDRDFLNYWCRKEAWLKALGRGITSGLDRYCVANPSAPRGPDPADDLTIVDVPVPRPFSSALCVLAAGQKVVALTCDPAQLPR
jgi:4'-phosphopantetheinyl transferase